MKYIAFLRAINVGGNRVVKMDRLRAMFEDLGYSEVATFIASGTVAFTSASADALALEAQIERKLARELGYEVATFLRTVQEVSAIARHDPFEAGPTAVASTLMIGFLRSAPAKAVRERVMGYRSDNDDFHVRGRELYWLVRPNVLGSKVSGALLEKALGPTTLRNVTTVRRLAARYG